MDVKYPAITPHLRNTRRAMQIELSPLSEVEKRLTAGRFSCEAAEASVGRFQSRRVFTRPRSEIATEATPEGRARPPAAAHEEPPPQTFSEAL